jgi:hypothetical protein
MYGTGGAIYIYIYIYIHTHIYIYIYMCVCVCVKKDELRQTTAEPEAGIKRGSQNISTSVFTSSVHTPQPRGLMQFDPDAQDDAALGPGLCYTATAAPYMA